MSASIRLPRFFVNPPLLAGPAFLDGDEAHQLMHVLRMGPGRSVTLFDGSGRESTAAVVNVGRRQVELLAGEPVAVSRENEWPVTLAVSLPKGDRQKVLVEKMTELGVTALIPLLTRRGVAQPTGNTLERLRKGVIHASRQCGRNRLMEITEPRSLEQLLSERAPGRCCCYAHPDPELPSLGWPAGSTAALVAIGPEGGFEDGELEAFSAAGWLGVGLAAAVLRVETAAVAAASRLAVRPAGI